MEEESRKSKTEGFMQQLAKRREGAAGKSSNGKLDVKAAATKEVAIQSDERKDATPPAPPAPRKVGDQWVQAVFNQDTWEYEWPVEVIEAEEKEKSKAGAKKEEEKKDKKPKGSALARFQKSRKEEDKRKTTQEPTKEPAKEAAPAAEPVKTASGDEKRVALEQTWELLLDVIAERVAEKLKG